MVKMAHNSSVDIFLKKLLFIYGQDNVIPRIRPGRKSIYIYIIRSEGNFSKEREVPWLNLFDFLKHGRWEYSKRVGQKFNPFQMVV
jgi:hypothetical protein